MLHKKGLKRILAIVLIVMVLFSFTNNTYAEINKDYYNKNKNAMLVSDSSLDDVISGSTLLSAVGALIYSVGYVLESILGWMYEMMTGSPIFPWADAIVFNAIPLLDVNFINPTSESGALVKIIEDALSNLYSTIFGLAVTFFAVAVMVMAIKLVLTTIASEKARYKQALVQWGMGLLLLFTIHYAMSFIMYLNEQLVNVASSIAAKNIDKAGVTLESLSDTLEYSQEKVGNFITTMANDNFDIGDFLAIVGAIVAVVAIVIIAVFGWYVAAVVAVIAGLAMLAWGVASGTHQELNMENAAVVFSTFTSYWETREEDIDDYDSDLIADYGSDLLSNKIMSVIVNGKKHEYYPPDVAAQLLDTANYVDYALGTNLKGDGEDFWNTGNQDPEYIYKLHYDVTKLISNIELEDGDGGTKKIKAIELFKSVVYSMENIPANKRVTESNYSTKTCEDGKQTFTCTEDWVNYDENIYRFCKAMVDVFEAEITKEASKVGVFTNLAEYFRKTAWTSSSTGWKPTRASVPSALMYAVFVVQSLILFIAYAKRLFYVIILGMMAPIVVVYDFFTKSA